MDKLILLLFVPLYLFSQDLQQSNRINFIEVDYFPPLFCDDCSFEDSFDDFHSFYGISTLVQDDLFQWNQLLYCLENLKGEPIESLTAFYNLKISVHYVNNSQSVIKINEADKLVFTEDGDFKLTQEVHNSANKLLCNQLKKENIRCVGIECNREMINNYLYETCDVYYN